MDTVGNLTGLGRWKGIVDNEISRERRRRPTEEGHIISKSSSREWDLPQHLKSIVVAIKRQYGRFVILIPNGDE